MAQQEPERLYDEQAEGLTDAELEAESAVELPDREALSIVSPALGLGMGPVAAIKPVPAEPAPIEPVPAEP
jgi:hypothetical protein